MLQVKMFGRPLSVSLRRWWLVLAYRRLGVEDTICTLALKVDVSFKINAWHGEQYQWSGSHGLEGCFPEPNSHTNSCTSLGYQSY